MKKSFLRFDIRRGNAPAFFFSIFILLCGQSVFAQASSKTYVTSNGIIMERVADEDIEEAERLNEESEKEDKEARARSSVKNAEEYEEKLAEGAENIEDADSIDELFGDEAEGDTEHAVTTPTTEIVKVDPKNKPVEFSGSLSAELGGVAWFYPWEDTKPVATFSNTLRFIGRPRSDFYVYGSFLTQFPQMDFGIYELYFDYTILGLVDLSAGKRDINWGHSRQLHTNLIDYSSAAVSGEKVLNPDKRTTDDSRFTLSISVPILSYASIQTIAQYQSRVLEEELPDYISLDAKVEVNLKHCSLSLLAKRWANQDTARLTPCVGGEIVSTILGKDSNLFAQGLIHFSTSEKNVNRARGTIGIYKYFENPIMLGASFEYQFIWDKDEFGSADEDEGLKHSIFNHHNYQHLFAAELFWSHFILTKKWTFGCKWFHDYKQDYGIVTPGITVESVLPYLDFKTTAPIYYGSQEKYGLVFELVLNLTY